MKILLLAVALAAAAAPGGAHSLQRDRREASGRPGGVSRGGPSRTGSPRGEPGEPSRKGPPGGGSGGPPRDGPGRRPGERPGGQGERHGGGEGGPRRPPDRGPGGGQGGPERPPGGGPGGGQGGGGSSVTGPSTPEELIEMALQQAKMNECKSPGYTCSDEECGTGLVSVFREEVDGEYRILITNGIPDHDYSTGATRPNPNEVCRHPSYMKVPLNPTKGSFTPSGMGPVGIALSGGFFYNHLSTPMGDVAAVVEAESFDSCSGHADPQCRYHYHKVPNCLNPDRPCELVGYMMDGFPVYSYCDVNGVRLTSCYKKVSGDGSMQEHFEYQPDEDCQLDEANGYPFEDGRGYGYVFSENYPFVMRGFMGSNITSICEVY
ncbi:uncharacterized protein [Penaeus vannamei]|uniref:uncharacterized protein isoform X2 n=1 Tax=Penaeus vannamei TaxID=6689 RepID=UPI00387FA2FC